VAVQGIGGLGHLAIQYAARMGFRTVAISRGADKAALARELGAHEYIDTAVTGAADGLQAARRGRPGAGDGAEQRGDGVAPWAGSRPRGKLLIVAAAFEPMKVSAMMLLSGKSIAGWPSGSAIDSEDTMAFSALTNVRPRVETFPLERAEEAFASMMEGRARFRAVLVP
jgi:D-arabinose 1-dehydrogenase-like Zn-dependent alcohol dehydrogenase